MGDELRDDPGSWICWCGDYVGGDHHCDSCGACPPWGGCDCLDEEGDGSVDECDPSEQGLWEREMDDALGPAHFQCDDD